MAGELIVMLARLFVQPLVFGIPLAIAVYRDKRLLSLGYAIVAGAAAIVLSQAVAARVYWRGAEGSLFDGVSIPILIGTGVLNFFALSLTFGAVNAVYRVRGQKSRHGHAELG